MSKTRRVEERHKLDRSFGSECHRMGFPCYVETVCAILACAVRCGVELSCSEECSCCGCLGSF